MPRPDTACPRCDSPIPVNFNGRKCPECGTALGRATSDAVTTSPKRPKRAATSKVQNKEATPGLQRRYWVALGVALVGGVLLCAGVVVALWFYTRQPSTPPPGPVDVAVVPAPPPVAPAAATPERPAAPPAPPRPNGPEFRVVYVEAAPPPQWAAGIDYGVLRREILRQAFLLAAREEFGLTTRDSSLHEPIQFKIYENQRFHVISTIRPGKTVSVMIDQGVQATRKTIAKKDYPQQAGDGRAIAPWVQAAEALARTDFCQVLKQAGFTPRAAPARAAAALPSGVEDRLARMTLTAQFTALRDLHDAMQAQGEAPELLGALVRAYANLGILTEHLWTSDHKVYKARALLYAERLRQRQPEAPWGLWHRAYARALTGLHGDAAADLQAAARLPVKAAPPAWVALLEPFCRFDASRLAELAAGPQVAQLGHLLQFLTVEDPECVTLNLTVGRQVLEENPECLRVLDALSGTGSVGNKHRVTAAHLEVTGKTLPDQIRGLPGLPASVGERLRRNEGRMDFVAAVALAGELGGGEPSLSVLGRLAQEARFNAIWRRVDFMAGPWRVPVDDFVNEALPLLQGHPYQNFIRSYAIDPKRDLAGHVNLLAGLPFDDLDLHYQGVWQAVAKADPQSMPRLSGRAVAVMDETYRDTALLLRYGNNLNVTRPLARRLLEYSPHAAAGIASLADLDAEQQPRTLKAWEKDEGHQAAVLRGLARRYRRQGQLPDAERCWKAYLKLSPDEAAYKALAEIYKAQGNLEQWKAMLDEYLRQHNQDLTHARVRVELARAFMQKKDYKQAQPYAEAAAQTWAAWAMICAHECSEALGEWDKAEAWIQRTSERYPDQAFEWAFWCKRTGRGDFEAAEDCAHKYLREHQGRLTVNDLVNLGLLCTLSGKHAEAAGALERAYQNARWENVALYYSFACQDAGNLPGRDQVWMNFPGKGTALARLVQLFREGLARKPSAALDAQAVDGLIAATAGRDQADCCYFAGRFLDTLGKGKEAMPYYRRCVANPQVNALTRIMAQVRLQEEAAKAAPLPGKKEKD